jgi:hypothetical protein
MQKIDAKSSAVTRWAFSGAAAAAWILAVLAGMAWLWSYASHPGAPLSVPRTWPVDTALTLDRQAPTLLFVLHPKCPCSRASIAELSRALSMCKVLPALHIVIVKPDGAAPGFERSDITQSASALPGATSFIDEGGVEAKRFGVSTSGHVLLFDPGGNLLFSGGITPARAHEGDNAGRSSLQRLLAGQTSNVSETPVYGCSVTDTSSQESESCPQCLQK